MIDRFKINFYSLRKKNLIPYFKSTQNISVLRGWWGILSFFTITNVYIQFFICKLDLSNCFWFRRQRGFYEWLAHQTCNVAVPGFSPALARPLIGFFLGYYEFKYSGMPVNCQLRLPPARWGDPVVFYVDYLFQILFIFNFYYSFKTFLCFWLAQVNPA